MEKTPNFRASQGIIEHQEPILFVLIVNNIADNKCFGYNFFFIG